MTSRIASAVTAKVMARLTGPVGLNPCLASLADAERDLAGQFEDAQMRMQHAAPEIAERAHGVKYPAVNVYCEKVANTLREKFRSFSGTVQIAIELRHSQDRLEGLQDRLELYVDAAMQVLDAQRGDWGDGMFFGGEFEAQFGGVKQGGRNFIQVAKIIFQIGVSRD